MAADYRASTAGSASAATSLALTVPGTVQAGDVMVLQAITSTGNVSISASGAGYPSDLWQPLRTANGTTTAGLWSKVATSSDAGATLTVASASSSVIDAHLIVLSGTANVPRGSVKDTAATSMASGTANGNTVGAYSGDIAVYMVVTRAGGSAPTLSRGTGVTSRADTSAALVGAYEVFSGSATPNPTVTLAATTATAFDVAVFPPSGSGRLLKGRQTATDDDAATA